MEHHPAPQLAILIGAPHHDQVAVHHDLVAMYNALRRRGLSAEEILCLEGKLDHQLLRDFLAGIGRRIARWQHGTLFFYVAGHGFFTGEQVEEARVGIELQPAEQVTSEYHIFWDEMLIVLAVPAHIKLILLPDH